MTGVYPVQPVSNPPLDEFFVESAVADALDRRRDRRPAPFTGWSPSRRVVDTISPYGGGVTMCAPERPAEHPRRLDLEGVSNFRDLGGYPAADGRTTRWRTLFRADGLHRLTDSDVTMMREIPLRTVVDLRTARELDERGRFPVESHPVAYHHLSVLDRTWDREQAIRENLPPAAFLHRAYGEMLADAPDRFAAAFGLLADADALPAVFHCAAGKDRTGLLAALVLGALGVSGEIIVEDYALTQASMETHLERLREDPNVAPFLDEVPASFFSADPDAMRRVIDDLEAAYGSISAYVASIGVSTDVVSRLQALLLTD